MNKSILIKLSIVLLLIIIISSFILTLNVNATTDTLDKNQSVTLEQFIDEEEKIMEYDINTGITKEVDMNKLRRSVASKNSKNGSYIDKTESYDPLAQFNLTNTNAIYDKVPDVSSFPYRVTCRIKGDVYGDELFASGFIVGPNILLTSAHCVMNANDNDNFFADWMAYPAYNYGSYNGICSGWSKVYYPSNWKSTHSPEYDWCVCILNSDIGNQVGWYGCQAYGTNSEMNNIQVRALGYALGLEHGNYQYYSTGIVKNTKNLYFDSSARVVGGFSGGPFVRTSDNYAIGVIHGYHDDDVTTSIGTRINQNIINLIKENS